jgi:hypothetical protein
MRVGRNLLPKVASLRTSPTAAKHFNPFKFYLARSARITGERMLAVTKVLAGGQINCLGWQLGYPLITFVKSSSRKPGVRF